MVLTRDPMFVVSDGFTFGAHWTLRKGRGAQSGSLRFILGGVDAVPVLVFMGVGMVGFAPSFSWSTSPSPECSSSPQHNALAIRIQVPRSHPVTVIASRSNKIEEQ